MGFRGEAYQRQSTVALVRLVFEGGSDHINNAEHELIKIR